MKTRLAGLIAGAAFVSLAGVTPSLAITYDYVGSAYTGFAINNPPFVPGSFMTGTLTFDFVTTPPDGIYSSTDAHIIGVSLHSGNYDLSGTSLFAANSSNFIGISGGQITSWFVRLLLCTSIPTDCTGTRNAGVSLRTANPASGIFNSGAIFDNVSEVFLFPPSNNAFSFQSGTWTQSPVPLPAAFPLFVSGIGGMGLLAWRRKRKAAAAIGPG